MAVQVALLEAAAVPAVAELHRRAFPHYESTQLGAGYCRRMLAAYAAHPEAWVVVARAAEGAGPIGYLVAAPPGVQRAVNRSLRPWAALAGLRAPRQLVDQVRARRRPNAPASPPVGPGTASGASASGAGPAGPPVPATLRLVLIGVDPAGRGAGAGGALLDDFAARARAAGHRVADLSVAIDNAAARRAYARYGWLEVGEEAGVAVRCRLDLTASEA